MNLERCHILGFGRLSGMGLDFKSGLNLICAPNEAGKSTLQRFLIAILYGQLRPDLKTQRRLDPWVDVYRPWRGPEYGGALWCRLANGREIEIRRTFGKEDARVEIRAGTGEDITREYEQQRNGDVPFARTHLGLPKELFESIAVIRENRAAELDNHATIRDRISNLAQSGDEELSVRQSLLELDNALEGIGSDRAPTRPYRQTLDRLQALQDEMKALEDRRKEYESWIADRGRLGQEVLHLESELQASQSETAAARWREAVEKVRVLEESDAEIRSLRHEIVTSPGREDFPARHLEDMNEQVGACESIGKRLADTRRELETAGKQLAAVEARREILKLFEPLASSGEADRISGWFIGYLRLSTHRDEALRAAVRCQEEIRAATDQLGRLGPAFSDPSVDWLARAMDAAERERKGGAENLQLAEQITEQKTLLGGIQDKTARLRLLGITAVALVLVPLGGWLLFGSENVPALIAWGASVLLGIASVPLLRAASMSRIKEMLVMETLSRLEARRVRLREESQAPQREIEQAMRSAGFATVEEFLAAAKRAEQWRQRVSDLEGRVRESEQQRDDLTAECTELYTRLQELLARAGLSCSLGTVKTQVDLFRENLKKFRDQDESYRACLRRVEALRTLEAELESDAKERNSRIQSILDEAGVESPEAFRQGCERRQRLLELREKESSREREFQRLCGNMTLQQWQEKLRELECVKEESSEAERVHQTSSAPAPVAGSSLPYLPYRPSVSDAEKEERRVASLLAASREEHARVVERVKQAFHNYREVSEIEEDLVQADRSLQGLERNRKSLEIALQTIQMLSREQQEVLAPQLNLAVQQRFLRLCRGRYVEVKIDLDFNIWVREAEGAELRKATSISRGTQDQLYLALRFGILDLVAGTDEPCPCLLDEPFAAYDRIRMLEAFRILKEEAGRRQLILFTCREDLREMGEDLGAHVLQLRQP
jgi:uncharacterized protein YhaN